MTCSAPSHYLNQYWLIVKWTLGTNFSEIRIGILSFSFKKMHPKLSSPKIVGHFFQGEMSSQTQTPLEIPTENSSNWVHAQNHIKSQIFINSLWPCDVTWWHIWVNIGSDNGLLPDRTKPLPEPMLTYPPKYFMAFASDQFHKNGLWTLYVTHVWRLHFWDYYISQRPVSWLLQIVA